MTTLQDTAVGPASQDEPRAPIAILSPAKRNALIACFNADGLHKKNGAWHGLPGGKPVSGMTTADLARWNVDGDHKSSIWFSTTDGARELVCAYVALSEKHCELRKRRLWKLLARAHAVIEGNGRVFILVQLRAADQQLSSSGSRRRQSRPKSFAYAGC